MKSGEREFQTFLFILILLINTINFRSLSFWVTVKVYHCANGNGPFDRHIGSEPILSVNRGGEPGRMQV